MYIVVLKVKRFGVDSVSKTLYHNTKTEDKTTASVVAGQMARDHASDVGASKPVQSNGCYVLQSSDTTRCWYTVEKLEE